MCKACQAYKKEYAETQDIRQGRVEPDDFEREVNYKPKKKVKSSRRYSGTGCAGNDGGPHVRVWTASDGWDGEFFRKHYGYYKYERYVCVGCGAGFKTRLSERYMKVKERKWAKKPDFPKGEPLSRWGRGRKRFKWWDWEDEDPTYAAAYKEHITEVNKRYAYWLEVRNRMKDNTG